MSVWVYAIAMGAVVGFLFLGIGGRIAMRVISVVGRAQVSVTFEGSLTVILLGAAIGAGGALIRVVLSLVRLPIVVVRLAYAAILLFLTLRGIHPVTPLPAALFIPLVAAYGVCVEILWSRKRLIEPRRPAPAVTPL
jgi:hypothetical protein